MALRARRSVLVSALVAVTVTAGLAAPGPAATADTTPPLTVAITQPTSGAVLRGPGLTLTIHVTDDPAASVSVGAVALGSRTVPVSRAPGCDDSSSCDETLTFSSVGADNGSQNLQVWVYDNHAQLVWDVVPVTVDNPVPMVSAFGFTTPPAGGAVLGDVGLRATADIAANPLGATLAGVRFYEDNQLVSEDDAAPYEASVPVNALHPRCVVLQAAAVDSLGDVGPRVTIDQLAEATPTVDIAANPWSFTDAWPGRQGPYVPIHAAAMPAVFPYDPNYLMSAQLLIDGEVRDTATPGSVHGQDPKGNCQLGCPFAAETTDGWLDPHLAPADAGWRTLTVRVTDARGGYGEATRRIYVDTGPTITLPDGEDLLHVPSGSTVHVVAAATANGPTTLEQTDVVADGAYSITTQRCNNRCGRSTGIEGLWNVAALDSGEQTLTFSATSSTGMTTTRTVRIIVVPSTTTELRAAENTALGARRVVLSGVVRRLGSHGLAQRAVALQRRADSRHVWTTVRRAHTGAGGKVRFSVTSSRSAQWRLLYAGTSSYVGSASRPVRITGR